MPRARRSRALPKVGPAEIGQQRLQGLRRILGAGSHQKGVQLVPHRSGIAGPDGGAALHHHRQRKKAGLPIEIEGETKGLCEKTAPEENAGAAEAVQIGHPPGHQLKTPHQLGRDRDGAALQQGDVGARKDPANPGQGVEYAGVFLRGLGETDQYALDILQMGTEIE